VLNDELIENKATIIANQLFVIWLPKVQLINDLELP